MKKLKSYLLLAAVATAVSLSVNQVSAQDRGDRSGGRGGFDPEQMRQRMMDRYREEFEIKGDDEWKLISERITKVMDARRDIGFGGGMSFRGFGRSGRDGGSSGSTNSTSSSDRGSRSRGGFGGEPSAEDEALQKAVEAKAPADEIKAKLAKVREARKQKEAKLEHAQDELRKVLTVRQEATAVLNGLLK